MNEQWTFGIEPYQAMISRHMPLWEYISTFIKENDIQSLVDVGGGMAYASKFVKKDKYVLYDQNEEMVKACLARGRRAVHGNFLEADLSALQELNALKKIDLVLILAVVEHAMVLEPFIKKALLLKPRYIMISFFHGLQENAKMISVKNGCQHRIYALKEVRDILEELRLEKNATVFSFKREAVVYPKNTLFDGVLLLHF